MNYYYITGTSRGLGKAIAEYLLENTNSKVIGLSRTKSINHANYTHHNLDLSDTEVVKDFQFQEHKDADRIVLINNAGTLGSIKHVGKLSAENIINICNLNIIAPCILTNSFMDRYKNLEAEKIILNVSSGAGKNPVDGWGMYCTSKAGLDMFSKVAAKEQELIQQDKDPDSGKNRFRILSIAPGAVDTEMQDEIRRADATDFSTVHTFIDYKKNDQLADPKIIAEKYIRLLNNIDSIKDTVISIKDFN